MEGEVGPQVAPPIFIHQALPGLFCEPSPMSKKRDLPWQNHGFHHAHHQQVLQLNSGLQSPKTNNWNPKAWVWDSVAFAAKPAPKEVDLLRLGTEPKKKGEEVIAKGIGNEDGENLTLKLGGNAFPPPVEDPIVRPNKRVRSGSPASGGGNYPMCQVDDCKADLSNAKDYHRRHKVCEPHSKTTKALVGQQMQRFCQQCSRFHPLSEFDEGKRSCRRRLAGHNRRRRKTQPQDVSSGLVLPGNNRENSGGGNLDIVNLLTILARLQGNNADKASCVPSILDRERLIQILGKINSLPVSADAAGHQSSVGRFDLNLSHTLQPPAEGMSQGNGNPPGPSTMDLLAVVSAALAASSPEKLAIFSQGTSNSKNSDAKSKFSGYNKSEELISHKQMGSVPLGGDDRSNGAFPSPAIPEVRTSLPLQLFNSTPEDDSPPNIGSSRKYFSSDSSNPMEERSPSSSPPVVQKLFPLHSSKREKVSISGEDMPVEVSTCRGWTSPKELFKFANSRAENSVVSNPPYQAGYTSSSGSDRSPSTSNSDSQDRTGRIMFKLFDKDPSHFPGTIKNQIFNWLSNSPSEMESYIRPGCVVLAVYASMPQFAWEELQEDLLQRVSSLIKGSDSDFWRSGRFLAQTERQLASHKEGNIRLCKSWKTWSAPELISVSPLAIVGGQETLLVLRGRNLTIPGTKIHCTYLGGYTSKEVSAPACSGTIYDDSCTENFVFPGGLSSKLGRCFIEVENGFKGNSFPLIIADASVCQELRILESEFEDDLKMEDIIVEDQYQYMGRPRSREDALHFLNELGWIFQRRCSSEQLPSGGFSLPRFKFLFTYSIERDWTALVRTLLDILLEGNTDSDGLSNELLDLLSEVQLLNRAVKRKCRKMVDMLLHYFVNYGSDASKKYLFPPNMVGSGGVTPLHLAACTQGSEEMVDALTNDPQEIGLNWWSSAMDENKHTPYMYALLRNHHSYNRLVARKVRDRQNCQVTIPVSDAVFSVDQSGIVTEPGKVNPPPLQVRSCAQCAVGINRRLRIPGAQGFLQRPYIHSMLAIAAVCVCVCLLFRGLPQIGSVAPFSWENVDYGSC